mgnify:CR=1 FL=1
MGDLIVVAGALFGVLALPFHVNPADLFVYRATSRSPSATPSAARRSTAPTTAANVINFGVRVIGDRDREGHETFFVEVLNLQFRRKAKPVTLRDGYHEETAAK